MAHNYVDGVTDVCINWDDVDGEYCAGQTLTGNIEVTVTEVTRFRGVILKLNGFMRIKWVEIENGSIIPYEEFQNLIYENLEVFIPDMKDPDARWIFPGKHHFEFKYKLPEKLPYSMDGSAYGRIEYKSKAEIIVPGINPVESLEEEFYILSKNPPEIEALQEMQEGKLPLENVEYGTLGGGCFVKKSHVEMFIKMEKSVYKQGQYIRPIIECTVEKGQCDVDAVMLLLVQEIIFTCNLMEDDERQKKEIMVITEDKDEADADPGETKVYDKLKVKIPRNLPPSGFPHCDFIDCGYFIHAVAKTATTYDDIVVKLPIMVLHGEDADLELDDDDPFEAGLNILIGKSQDEGEGENNEEMDNADQGDEENTDEINVEADGEENVDGADDEQNLPGQIEVNENEEVPDPTEDLIEEEMNEMDDVDATVEDALNDDM